MRMPIALALLLLVAAAPGDALDRELRAMEAEWSAPDAAEPDLGAWIDRLVALEPRACTRPAYWWLWGTVNLQAEHHRDAALGLSIAHRMGYQPRTTRVLLARTLLAWSREFPRGPGDRPDPVLDVLRRARALVEEGRADESLSRGERAEFEALDLRCMGALATALQWSRSYAGAEELYRELIRRQPGVMRHRIGLGRTLLTLKRPEEALVVVAEARRLRPDPEWLDPEALLGTIHSRLGHEEAAERHYATYLAGRPDHVLVLKRLAEHYSRNGRFGPAVETYLRVVEIAPDDSGVYQALATALIRLERREEAEKYMAIYRKLSAQAQERRGVRGSTDD